MRDVFVTGTGMTPFGKFPDATAGSMAMSVVRAALADSGISADDVGMVFYANAIGGLVTGQEMIRGQVALQGSGLDGLPIINVENACASASSAFHLAWMSVASGQTDIAIAVGSEKMTHPDKRVTFAAIGTARDLGNEETFGAGEPADTARSPFMDIYAAFAEDYRARTDATEADFAAVAVKNQRFGSRNNNAQYGAELTIEDVLASRTVAGQLRLLMCSPIGDGAAAVVVSADPGRDRSAVRVLATAMASAQKGQQRTPVERAASAAYEQAGVGPGDIDVAEVHDATAPAELVIYEELGMADRGSGVALIRSGATDLGGSIPVNTSGGLLSRGHPIGATGCAQLVELTEQLRGRSGARQVSGANVGLAENAGGHLHGDVATAVVTILSAS
jgi:acetyl-CoA acetyltransferase